VRDVIEHDRLMVWPMQRLQGAIINAQSAIICGHRSA
jgi:hypothetical protein